MNKVPRRVQVVTPEDEQMVQRIEAGQTDERIQSIVADLRHEPLARWKESFKEVSGLPTATEAGEDR